MFAFTLRFTSFVTKITSSKSQQRNKIKLSYFPLVKSYLKSEPSELVLLNVLFFFMTSEANFIFMVPLFSPKDTPSANEPFFANSS